ncbi:MAG: CPBP family glutamic-type intramembrane protease [Phycisphaerales bacterium]
MVLVFLLPLVMFYEIGAATVLHEGERGSPLVARTLISTLFELFGVVGLHLPAVLLVVVLLAQHAVGRRPWRVPWAVPPLMAVESLVWALPLLVMGGVLGVVAVGGTPPLGVGPFEASVVAIGAGIYEELVFRFALIAGMHLLLVEVCGVREQVADWLSLVGSAVAFSAYHGLGPGGSMDASLAAFYLGAGLLLAWLFLIRGLGIAAGAHAVYDLVVLLVLPALGERGG